MLLVRYVCVLTMDGFPSGQRGQTVNLLQIASVVRIHLHPFNLPMVNRELLQAYFYAGVAELADAQDLKSCGANPPYRFDSGRRQCLKVEETLIFTAFP